MITKENFKKENAKAIVIAVANEKGGVGKTTTTVNVACELSKRGFKVLVIDSDPQGSSSSYIGCPKPYDYDSDFSTVITKTIFELPFKDRREGIVENIYKTVDVLPADKKLSIALAQLDTIKVRPEMIYRRYIETIRDDYDFIIMDAPPTKSTATYNILAAAEYLIIPLEAQYMSAEGVNDQVSSFIKVRNEANTSLKLLGLVFTKVEVETNLAKACLEMVSDAYPTFETMIPKNIKVAESPAMKIPVVDYAPKSTGAEAYRNLTEEILNKLMLKGGNE